MRRVVTSAFVLLFCSWAPFGAAQAQEPKAPAGGEVVQLEAPAPALRGNLLETPATQPVAVYLPPGYRTERARRYPVIYLLHGYGDSPAIWLAFGLPKFFDQVMVAGKMPELIIVMPNGGNVYGGSYYRNSPVSGNWADFISRDLVRFIDGKFRTLARPGGRAIVGWSMGGLGAIHLAMERPGLYAAAYAISPCCLAPVEEVGLGNGGWNRAHAVRSREEAAEAIKRGDIMPAALLGFLSAMSPAPKSPPLYVEFPFVVEPNGQRVPNGATYDRFVAQFPVSRVAQALEALRSLRALGLEYGIDDQYAGIPRGVREFSQRLAELRIPHRLDVYEGDHRERVPERLLTIVLPYVAGVLDQAE